MNPQPVSLDFTKNVASNASANSSKSSADSSKTEDNQFKKELSKQETNHRSDEEVKAKPQNNTDKKETEPVSETERRASVAAEEVQNGEALPESEVATEVLIEHVLPASLINEIPPETLVSVPDSVLALPLDSDFSAVMAELNTSTIDDPGATSLLESQSAYLVTPGAVPGLVPVSSKINTDAKLNTLDSVLGSEAQPVDKLMTLNQIKASLENSLETMTELEIDVDIDTESSVKEVMRFNDIQLKENQSTLKSYTTSVPLPMSQSAWGEQVSDKVVWLANQKIQFAEIHINPQELGPVEVKINMQNEQTAITFTSPHQGVRDLLEMNVNRLREMMSENGVDLTHVDVSDQSSQHEPQEEDESGGTGLVGAEGELVGLEGEEANVLAIEQVNLVDYYA